MTYEELPDLLGLPSRIRRPILYCGECDGRYSAQRGDYFLREPTDTVTCGCGGLMRLMVERTILEPWSPPA